MRHFSRVRRSAGAAFAVAAGVGLFGVAAAGESEKSDRGRSGDGSVQMDGSALPDRVLALTWDDGPDAHTLDLARYLHQRHVAATFFVVEEWKEGLSSDPGLGRGVYETGHAHLPVLHDLVRLGHRLGNHTAHHVLLSEVSTRDAAQELAENERALAPYVADGVHFFRAPGGAWNGAVADAVALDPRLASLVGPVRWDVDRKDWDGSLACSSDAPSVECEASSVSGHRRVKPRVMAARYLASIEQARRGIVLLHDRVGDVGSDYALQLARALIPELEARGYVFAAPVLGFSPLRARAIPPPRREAAPKPAGPSPALGEVDPRTLRFGDLNGDGRDDVCARGPGGVVCALSTPRGFTEPTLWLARGMADADGWADAPPERVASLRLVDVSGDLRADLCMASTTGETVCGLAP